MAIKYEFHLRYQIELFDARIALNYLDAINNPEFFFHKIKLTGKVSQKQATLKSHILDLGKGGRNLIICGIKF